MERQVVDSDALVSIGYDAQAQVLEIEFRGGKVYQYTEVPPDVHAWLMRVPGKQSYFRRMIDGKYTYRRVDHLPAQPLDLEAALRASLARGEPPSHED